MEVGKVEDGSGATMEVGGRLGLRASLHPGHSSLNRLAEVASEPWARPGALSRVPISPSRVVQDQVTVPGVGSVLSQVRDIGAAFEAFARAWS